MKSPDEIKKGLECCSLSCLGRCPYAGVLDCSDRVIADALALIQQLESKLECSQMTIDGLTATLLKCDTIIKQLEAERDAFKEALGLMVYQYCVRGDKLDHMYMCAGETAFRVLGLEQYGDTRTLESWLFPECQEEET